jgi:intracellular multiplication protein IcmN
VRRLRVGRSVYLTWRAVLSAFLVIAVLSCVGCFRHPKLRLPPDDTYKLPRRVPGSADVKVVSMMKAFNRGRVVKVISIGSDYLIAIPSSALFPADSPQINWQSYAVLNQVAAFLKQFRKVAITITSYSGKYGHEHRAQALTLARSRTVGDYLWSQGVDTRFVFTEGAGSDKPLSGYFGLGDNPADSRIEITFRDTVA